MALYFNNTNIATNAWVYINNQAQSKVYYNNNLVWQRDTNTLYNNGDQCNSLTGGWAGRSIFMSHANYWYGTGTAAGTSGTISLDSQWVTLHTTAGGAVYQGIAVSTVNKVSLTGVTNINAQGWAYESNDWNYTFIVLGVSTKIGNTYEPVANSGKCIVQQIRGANSYTTTLNVSELTGNYYIYYNIAVSDREGLGVRMQKVWKS